MYHNRDYRKCQFEFCDGKKRIEELEAENAALKQAELSRCAKVCLAEERLIEAQHRIKQLREALEQVVATSELSLKEIGDYMRITGTASMAASEGTTRSFEDLKRIKELLTLPDSTAELDAALKKDAERYRFIKSVQPTPEGYDAATVERLVQERDKANVYPPEPLRWLYSHCTAIGMTCKSDSGKWEHDIALFTINQKNQLTAMTQERDELVAIIKEKKK